MLSILGGLCGYSVFVPLVAQGLVTEKSISLPLARTIAEAALSECKGKGFSTAVAVVDRGGQLLVLLRDENASANTVEMARRKAYTARMFKMTTLELRDRTSDPKFAAQRDIPDILALGGGGPITVGAETSGGVASSGSSQDQDEAGAKAGLAKAEGMLK